VRDRRTVRSSYPNLVGFLLSCQFSYILTSQITFNCWLSLIYWFGQRTIVVESASARHLPCGNFEIATDSCHSITGRLVSASSQPVWPLTISFCLMLLSPDIY